MSKKCISMVAFGMKTMLICFQDKCFHYKEAMEEGNNKTNEDDNGLVIETFEAAFCAVMGETFVYEICEEIIKKVEYVGSYCNDGLTFLGAKCTQPGNPLAATLPM